MLGNNIGIGGTVSKTKKFLKKLSKLLKNDSQILAIVRRIPNIQFVEVKLRPVWKEKIGLKFDWIHLNIDFLSDLCDQAELHIKVLQGNQHYYLIRIAKKSD